MEQPDLQNDRSATSLGKAEVVLLAVVLVAAHHAIPSWLLWHVLPVGAIYNQYGPHGVANIHDLLSGVMPLLLCLGAASRSGLCLGTWKPRFWNIAVVCAVPAVLVAIVSPFTSQPFKGDRIGSWLISPAAQDLLFSGYLFGLLKVWFPGRLIRLVPLDRAVVLTAVLFSLWHTPNFVGIGAAFVTFQLFYTFLFYCWILRTRQWTGSILPVVIAHMAANFVDW